MSVRSRCRAKPAKSRNPDGGTARAKEVAHEPDAPDHRPFHLRRCRRARGPRGPHGLQLPDQRQSGRGRDRLREPSPEGGRHHSAGHPAGARGGPGQRGERGHAPGAGLDRRALSRRLRGRHSHQPDRGAPRVRRLHRPVRPGALARRHRRDLQPRPERQDRRRSRRQRRLHGRGLRGRLPGARRAALAQRRPGRDRLAVPVQAPG